MKKNRWTIVAVVVCLLIAVGYILWGLQLDSSVTAYRSPLSADPPKPGEPIGSPITRRVVFILVDGLRVDTAKDAEVMPFLAQLKAQGASATMHSRAPSYSTPGYAVLLTGAWPDLNDSPAFNMDYADLPSFSQDHIFAAVHRAGMGSGISAYYWFEKLAPQDTVSVAYYTPGEDDTADREVVDQALEWLADPDIRLILVHIDQVDHAGHQDGALGEAWRQAAANADAYIEELAAELDLSQDTILILSDHGHIDQGGHGGTEPVLLAQPFVLAGAGVTPGLYEDIQMVDIAPTIAALLGVNLPASTQGQARAAMLDLTTEQRETILQATAAQQAQLLEHYQRGAGSYASSASGEDVVAATQSAIENARSARLRSERLPRLIAALFLATLPLLLFWVKRGVLSFRIMLGVVVYHLVFNFTFVLILRKHYSFSTISSMEEFLVSYALMALIGIVAAGIALLWRVGDQARMAKTRADAILALTLSTVYTLSLPILLFSVMYGPWVTWTLPDFDLYYLALHGLVQGAFCALFGMIFAGAVAWWTARRTKQNTRINKEIIG